jgi:hypothetical protein
MLKIVAPLSRTASSMGIYRANAAIPADIYTAPRAPGSRCCPASHCSQAMRRAPRLPRERFITAVIAIRQERLCTTTPPTVP